MARATGRHRGPMARPHPRGRARAPRGPPPPPRRGCAPVEGLASTHDVLKTLRPLFSIAADPGRSAGQLLPGGGLMGGMGGWVGGWVRRVSGSRSSPTRPKANQPLKATAPAAKDMSPARLAFSRQGRVPPPTPTQQPAPPPAPPSPLPPLQGWAAHAPPMLKSDTATMLYTSRSYSSPKRSSSLPTTGGRRAGRLGLGRAGRAPSAAGEHHRGRGGESGGGSFGKRRRSVLANGIGVNIMAGTARARDRARRVQAQ